MPGPSRQEREPHDGRSSACGLHCGRLRCAPVCVSLRHLLQISFRKGPGLRGCSGFFRSAVVARLGGSAGVAGGACGFRGDDLRLEITP